MEFEQLLVVLRRGPLDERRRAYWRLSERAQRGLSEPEQLALLEWAAQPLPPLEAFDASAALIALAGLQPRPALAGAVERLYSRLPSSEARAHALDLLNGLAGRPAAHAYAGLLRDYDPDGRVRTLATEGLQELPRHAEVIFPLLYRWADHPRFGGEVRSTALAYARSGLLAPARLAPAAAVWIAALADAGVAVRDAAGWHSEQWRWGARYRPTRVSAAELLELAGYLPEPIGAVPLQDALQWPDPWLRFTALRALARFGDPFARLDAAGRGVLLAGLGGDLETRAPLHRWLRNRGEPERMPPALREEPAVAAGALAERLLRHPDLAAVPEQMELVVTLAPPETGGGRYHLFRFRFDAGHPAARHGWLAGLAGPFGGPVAAAAEQAATALEPWSSRTPAEHLRQLRGR